MSIEYNPYANTNKDFVAIDISGSDRSYRPGAVTLYCNLCSCNLVVLDSEKEGGEWFCNRCHVSYFPNKGEKVKRPSKFETPGPETDRHGNITGDGKMPLISMVEYDANSVRPKKPVFPKSLEGLKRTGVSITNFTSTVDNEGV